MMVIWPMPRSSGKSLSTSEKPVIWHPARKMVDVTNADVGRQPSRRKGSS